MSEKDIEAIELLKKDYELGIFNKQEFEDEMKKLGYEGFNEQMPDYKLHDEKTLKIYHHIEIIKNNLKPICKMILENKWFQKNVNNEKIVLVGGDYQKHYNLYSITYINKYGQFISVDLKDVVFYLDKIDFDE